MSKVDTAMEELKQLALGNEFASKILMTLACTVERTPVHKIDPVELVKYASEMDKKANFSTNHKAMFSLLCALSLSKILDEIVMVEYISSSGLINIDMDNITETLTALMEMQNGNFTKQ